MAINNKRSLLVLTAIIAVGFLLSLWLCFSRYQVEEENMTIEQVMDYDAVVSMGKSDGYDLEQTLALCRDAGITSFAIYDATLNKLTQRGEVSLITRLGCQLYYPQFGIGDLQYDYYLIGKPLNERDPYFDELVQDLALRLGGDKVQVLANDRYRIAGLRGVMPALGEMNLGILSADAKAIAAAGFHVVLRPTNYSNAAAGQVQAFFDRARTIPDISGIMFVGKEVMGYTAQEEKREDMLEATAAQMKQGNYPFYMIESVTQLQYNTQDGMYELAELLGYRTARVYAMSKEELEKVSPEEAAMRYYISDLERNVRVNLYPLYKKPLHGMNLTQTNLDYIKQVSDKLGERGYSLGKASVLPVYYPERVLLALTAAAAACGFLFTFNLLVPLADRKNYLLTALACLAGCGGAFLAKGALFLQIMAIGCAVTAPTAAILLLLDWFSRKKLVRQASYAKVIRDGVLGLTAAVAVAMIGGFFIAAMLGNIRFFLEFDFYRGVKLTFLLPIVLAAWGYLRRFPLMGHTLAAPQDFISFAKDFLAVPIRMSTLLLLAFFGAAAYIFIGRSGHTAGVPVPGAEVVMRRFLENVMYARPREKEFLIGHPAFFLLVAAIYRKWPQLLHFFLVLASVIGVGSMVETFAHIRTPFLMSFIRGVNGWVTGMILGILLIVAVAILQYSTTWLRKELSKGD